MLFLEQRTCKSQKEPACDGCRSPCARRTTEDDELFQLTSAARAKAEHFDSSAAEQELDTSPQRLQFGNTNCFAPKIAKKLSPTRWTSSTPYQDVHPSRPSSSVLSSQTPVRYRPSALNQEKVTSSLGDSISTEPPTTSPFQSFKKKKIMKDSEELQSMKRGGQSSVEKAKKKWTKRHHHRTSKTKTPPTAKQLLGPPSEVQIPDVEAEVCDSFDCCRPTDNTLAWVQCDSCDSWYHVTCVGCDYDSVRKDSAAFHCGCSK